MKTDFIFPYFKLFLITIFTILREESISRIYLNFLLLFLPNFNFFE